MATWACSGCWYTYEEEAGDQENGIAPGTTFEALPEDWACPNCGAPKSMFGKIG